MHDLMDAFKALGLHGMASAWPEVLGTARMKSLDHEAVLHQLIKAETAQREVRSMAYQMRVARFPSHRDLAGFDFAHTLNRSIVSTISFVGTILDYRLRFKMGLPDAYSAATRESAWKPAARRRLMRR
ncbi:ATP-binding protein [Hydrogenophaga sp. NH-16]|uniref:ATP-binding protein n=1 Tax=Hydrogenophaga sp. NH-16 TaxID=2184519 RepID=UPI00240D1C1E|nr:ATP-binding protein [Hydrogenophaga sp. NH-16]